MHVIMLYFNFDPLHHRTYFEIPKIFIVIAIQLKLLVNYDYGI